MANIAEIRKLSVPPEVLPVSDELAEELQRRLEAHRASPKDSEPWESVDRKVFGAD
jgi:putative addiction module component (TIGR02574 family)